MWLYRVTGIPPFIKISFILFEIWSLISLNWLLLSGLKRLIEGEAKYGAIIPLSFIISIFFSFIISNAWMFIIEDSVIVFVIFLEVFPIVSVSGSYNFLYIVMIIMSTKRVLSA